MVIAKVEKYISYMVPANNNNKLRSLYSSGKCVGLCFVENPYLTNFQTWRVILAMCVCISLFPESSDEEGDGFLSEGGGNCEYGESSGAHDERRGLNCLAISLSVERGLISMFPEVHNNTE